MSTVIDLISSSDKLKIISEAFKSTKINELLEGPGPFTVFAPTDLAIAQAPASRFKDMEGDTDKLSTLAKHHIVRGHYDTKKLLDMLKRNMHVELEGICGHKLVIRISGFFRSHIRIESAAIVAADLKADNGVVHSIDSVLFPP